MTDSEIIALSLTRHTGIKVTAEHFPGLRFQVYWRSGKPTKIEVEDQEQFLGGFRVRLGIRDFCVGTAMVPLPDVIRALKEGGADQRFRKVVPRHLRRQTRPNLMLPPDTDPQLKLF